MSIDQDKLYQLHGIPPSRAMIKVTGPVSTTGEVNTKLFQAGLTADQLKPIDWRQAKILTPILNQQQCGDCWAMSSTCVITDRYRIKSKDVVVDPAITAQCAAAGQYNSANQGCNGGLPLNAGLFFENQGIPVVSGTCPTWDQTCSNNCKSLPSCDSLLSDCTSGEKIYAIKGSTKNLTVFKDAVNIDIDATITNIKTELVNGPVVACFFVPCDLMANNKYFKWNTTGGIYINGAYNDNFNKLANDPSVDPATKSKLQTLQKHSGSDWGQILTEGGSPAGHAVSIVGWGVGDAGKYGKVEYWIVRNSWGTSWADDGFFKMAITTSKQNFNAKLGFDIPVFVQGQSFGGCTSFDPLIDQVNNSRYQSLLKSAQGDKSGFQTKHIFLIIIPLLILGALIFFGWKYRKYFKKHKRTKRR